MTILKLSYYNIREALDRIFDKWAENNADSFTVSALMNYDTGKVTWGVNLSSRGVQATEVMDETIKRLTIANNICKNLNKLDITVEWTDDDTIHKMIDAGKKEKAYEINEHTIECLANDFKFCSTVETVFESAVRVMDENLRSNNI